MSDTFDWWDIRERALAGLGAVQEILKGPTLSSESLDDLTEAIRDYNEAIATANNQLGLTSQ